MSRITSRLVGGTVLLVSICWGWGCYHVPSKPIERGRLVGDYVYHCTDSGAPHPPDRLSLKADGSYVLVHMQDGRPSSTERGTWQPWTNLGQPQVAFGKRTYPVEVKGRHVRLVINNDLGHYYEKTG